MGGEFGSIVCTNPLDNDLIQYGVHHDIRLNFVKSSNSPKSSVASTSPLEPKPFWCPSCLKGFPLAPKLVWLIHCHFAWSHHLLILPLQQICVVDFLANLGVGVGELLLFFSFSSCLPLLDRTLPCSTSSKLGCSLIKLLHVFLPFNATKALVW